MLPTLAPGTLLAGTYRIVRMVGQGGMGEVYEASHNRLAGRYAVKVLRADLTSRSDALARFRREAEVTSALRHPNIVQVLDFNVTPDGHQFLVMEFLEGRELAEELTAGRPLPMWRVLDVVGQVASALQAAHARGIVHRDLKPANLFLVTIPGEQRELVKVVDFGISKVREATTQITQEMTIMGTPRYMSPEQAQGRLDLIDQRTDQFALAAICYELLAGQAAFAGEVTTAVLYQIVNEMPAPLGQMNPAVNAAVEQVVQRALAKRPADRFPSIREFADQLADAAGLVTGWPSKLVAGNKGKTTAPTSTLPERSRKGEGPSTTLREASGEAQPPPPAPAPTVRRPPRRWLGLALFLAGVAAGGWWMGTHGIPRSWRQADTTATPAPVAEKPAPAVEKPPEPVVEKAPAAPAPAPVAEKAPAPAVEPAPAPAVPPPAEAPPAAAQAPPPPPPEPRSVAPRPAAGNKKVKTARRISRPSPAPPQAAEPAPPPLPAPPPAPTGQPARRGKLILEL